MSTDNLPKCPACKEDMTYPDGDNFVCAQCGHEWPMSEAQEEEVEEEETDEEALTYNETFNVWVHEVSGMYYGVNDIESVPLGQLKSGKLVPFKKPSCKRIGAN